MIIISLIQKSKIVNTSNNTFGIGFTDSLDILKMRVPVNAPLQLNVITVAKMFYCQSKLVYLVQMLFLTM